MATAQQTLIRPEQPSDWDAITYLTQAAFATQPYSSHTEHFIVSALRHRGQLTVSLVSTEEGEVVGHVAISPVSISSGATGWYGLGPISVLPAKQQLGIGTQLMHAALAELRQQQAQGCVVLGDPAYYVRFGFQPNAALVLPDVPAAYFQVLALAGPVPTGTVQYDEAFDAVS